VQGRYRVIVALDVSDHHLTTGSRRLAADYRTTTSKYPPSVVECSAKPFVRQICVWHSNQVVKKNPEMTNDCSVPADLDKIRIT
jgi:hypothetical protein